jgi:hypothetical protein
MPITPQSLADIKTSLTNISSGISSLSPTEKAKFEKSSSSDTLSKGLTTLSGTLTSEQARRAVDTAKKDTTKTTRDGGLAEQYSKLFAENSKTKADLAATQAKLTSAEGGLSIADQQKKQVEDEAAAALLKGKKKGAATTDPNAPVEADSLEALAGDSIANKAMLDSMNEQRSSITSQLDVLKQQTLDADDDTRFMVRQIENMANQQIQRQEKANEAMVRGAKVAGLSAGLAQYSPETHSGIVQETINEGLALIQDIEFKAMEKKYQAKKDLRDFNYKSYLDSQKLITEYNDLKNQTIIKMYDQLQKEETNAREQMKFDNEQADRNAIIIAPELMDATPEQIAQAAAANGIEIGALTRAVNDAKYEKESRALDLESSRENIKTQQFNRYIAGLKASEDKKEEDIKPMSKDEIESFNASNGWTPPFGMSLEEAQKVEESFSGEPGAVKLARAREILYGSSSNAVDSSIDDVTALASEDEGVQKSLDGIRKDLKMNGFFGIGGKDVLESDQFKGYVAEAQAEAIASGKRLTTREIVDLAAKMAIQDVEVEKAEKKKKQKEVDESSVAYRTANSTQAIRLK